MESQQQEREERDGPSRSTQPHSEDGRSGERVQRSAIPIVGIGASAGGLPALEEVFRRLPLDSGAAFVVLQHLSPDFKSHMAELLGRVTRLPVQQASESTPLEPNHVYLIPPRKEMIVSSGVLLLRDKDPDNPLSRPIDQFFRSMAQEAGDDAIAVVLSGTGSDGARGVAAVSSAGGAVIVQDPSDAAFDGMPKSAIATGLVDVIVPAGEIPATLSRLLADMRRQEPRDVQPTEPGAEQQIIELLRAQHQIDFSCYKGATFSRRIRRRMELTGSRDIEGYVNQLRQSPQELSNLYHDLLIGVTQFFRDPNAYQRLAELIECEWFDTRKEELRIWVAGCATGEEAYSIAMLVDEGREQCGWSGRIKIFATDVHGEALQRASDGIYTHEAIRDLPELRRQRYFQPEGNIYRVDERLREMIVFARHNLITDAPFTQLDLICCRNVLIYLQPDVQEKILALFHFALHTGGVLFLGPSETPGKLRDEFKPVEGTHQIFTKRREVRLVAPALERRLVTPIVTPQPESALATRYSERVLREAYDVVLDRHVSSAFLLDDRQQLVHCFAGAEKYLHFKPGRVNTHVTELMAGRLRTAVAGLLHRLKSDTTRAHTVQIRATDEPNGAVRITASAVPIRSSEQPYALVSIEPLQSAVEPVEHTDAATAYSNDYVESLERDLELAESNLQTTVEALEASNEELQSTNEELVAANEELQSTNEELQSVNEELTTVNAEYQKKIEQLTEVTQDLDSLLQGINVGVLYLDAESRIRRLNEAMEQLLELDSDQIGNLLARIRDRFHGYDIVQAVGDVRESAQETRAEIQLPDGRVALIHLMPHRSGQEQGVVVTVIDITSTRRAESEAERLSAIVRNARDAIIGKDLNGVIHSWNSGAEKLFGYTEAEAVGRNIGALIPEEYGQQEKDILARIAKGEDVTPIESVRIAKDGRRINVQLSISPVRGADGSIVGASTLAWDITARKLAERQASLALEQRDKFLAQLSHELRNPLMALSNATELLRRQKDTAQTERATMIVSRQIIQMSRLLEDMLDASRMRHDKIELKREVIDLRSVVDSALDAVRARAEDNSIELIWDSPDEPLLVKADWSRLQQIVVNLAQNAITHSVSGKHIRISAGHDGDETWISVEDDGRGIRPDELPKIFEPFFQGTGANSQGMGLGLALAKAIALAHGGTIVAESDGEQRGARFELRLPARADATGNSGELPSLEGRGMARRTSLMLVDDDVESREMLAVLLREADYHVVEADDGKQAFALLEQGTPSVAVIDIGLPDISGYEIARRIRSEFGSQTIRLIALTGYGQQSDREAAMEAGFDMHLVKPLDYATVETVIAHLASR